MAGIASIQLGTSKQQPVYSILQGCKVIMSQLYCFPRSAGAEMAFPYTGPYASACSKATSGLLPDFLAQSFLSAKTGHIKLAGVIVRRLLDEHHVASVVPIQDMGLVLPRSSGDDRHAGTYSDQEDHIFNPASSSASPRGGFGLHRAFNARSLYRAEYLV